MRSRLAKGAVGLSLALALMIYVISGALSGTQATGRIAALSHKNVHKETNREVAKVNHLKEAAPSIRPAAKDKMTSLPGHPGEMGEIAMEIKKTVLAEVEELTNLIKPSVNPEAAKKPDLIEVSASEAQTPEKLDTSNSLVLNEKSVTRETVRETYAEAVERPTYSHSTYLRENGTLIELSRGNPNDKKLSITFDGGSRANHADEILYQLKKHDIKTTLFITGNFIKRFPYIVKRMVEDGHEIANHMRSHPHLTTYEDTFTHRTLPHVDKAYVLKQLRETEELFTSLTGQSMAPYWRAPYGEINAEIREWAASEGFLHIGWTADYKARLSLDTLDWVEDEESNLYRSAEEIKERLVAYDDRPAYNKGEGGGLSGGIVLMHLGTPRTNDRASKLLGSIIDEITGRGYKFVKISELAADKVTWLTKKGYQPRIVLKSTEPVAKIDEVNPERPSPKVAFTEQSEAKL